jgi:hydroxymethylglutaryl-CoA lyase
MDHLQFVVSVSESHSLANAGRTPEAGLTELTSIAAALPAGCRLEVTLATAFGCPYEGRVAPGAVMAAVDTALSLGACAVSLADTIGTAIPSEVTALVHRATALASDRPVGVHLHDTRGLGVANALAALDAGARRIDGSVGGLGGCPFAPGASGNLALEDLVHVLRETGYETGIDLDALIDAAHLACRLVGKPVDSHVGKAGPRYRTVPS